MRGCLGLMMLLALGCGQTLAEKEPPTPTADTHVGAAARKGASSATDTRAKGAVNEVALPVAEPRAGGVDWPGFLGPAGDSTSPEKGILSPWPEQGLRLVWKREVGEGYGMPSIARGRLLQFERVGDKARLNCLNSTTGELLWTFAYPTAYEDDFGYSNGPRCSPVIDDDRAYIYGAEGMLHCLNVADGKLLWKVDTMRDFGVIKNFFGVGSTPVIFNDLLLVHVGGSPPGSADEPFGALQGNGSAVVAFDKLTGKVRYQTGDELASYAGPVLATIDGRPWCFQLARGGLLGFDPRDGKIDFHFPWRADDLASVNASNPVVAGDKVFITETYGPGSACVQVRPGGYKVLWTDENKPSRDKSLQGHWCTPIHHKGYLYGCSGRYQTNGELRCVELATGKVRWRKTGLGRTSLLMVDGHLLALSETGLLVLLKVNPDKYEEISRLDFADPDRPEYLGGTRFALHHDPYWAAPILSHGLLYVRGQQRLACFELIPRERD